MAGWIDILFFNNAYSGRPLLSFSSKPPKERYESPTAIASKSAGKGPVFLCSLPDCPGKKSTCDKFHPDSDCEKWVINKYLCDGICDKNHRPVICGRNFGKNIEAKLTTLIGSTDPIIVNQQTIEGEITVGLMWDVNPNAFDKQPVPKSGLQVSVRGGDGDDMNLCAGLFNRYGDLIHSINAEKVTYNSYKDPLPAPLHFTNSVFHSGNDSKGGLKNRTKAKFMYNEYIKFDFRNIPEEVQTIVVGAQCNPYLIGRLMNASLDVFKTPPADNAPAEYLVKVPLERYGEMELKTCYSFAKFVRDGAVWNMLPIQQSINCPSADKFIEDVMPRYVVEQQNMMLPQPIEQFDFYFGSFSKDFSATFPVEIRCLCYDFCGRLMPNIFPFEVSKERECTRLKFKPNKSLMSVIFYAEQTQKPDGNLCFNIVPSSQKTAVINSIVPIGGLNQYIGSITCRVHCTEQSWEVKTYSGLIPDQFIDPASVIPGFPPRYLLPTSLPERADKQARLWKLVDLLPPKFLNVEVISGHHLAVKDLVSSDPYIVVKFGSNKFITSVKKNTLDPVWEETGRFSILVSEVGPDNGNITIKCKDWNKIQKHGFWEHVL